MPSAHPILSHAFTLADFLRPLKSGMLWCGLMYMAITPLYGQLTRNCGTMGHLEELMKSHPSMRINMQAIENQRLRVAKGSSLGVTGRINIPVVIHVVYHTETQNISDQQIYSQIQVLNQDFQRKNPDRYETPAAFQAVASSPNLHFHLAKRDPSGLATTGITRTYSPKTVFYTNQNDVKRSSMGGSDAWPADQYLNIWVCPLANGVLGYAQFPGGPAETDGVVINYKAFGTIGTVTAPFDKGRTTTHEVGHWLNLKHIWGDRYGMCEEDDEVGDTPPTSNPHYGCSREAHSCDTEDMPSNFMDYTDDACMNLFTFGQAERMRALFAPGGYRSALLRSPALQPIPEDDIPSVIVAHVPPSTVTFSALSASGVRIDWGDVKGSNGYRIRLRKMGETTWLQRRFNRTYINAVRLANCTEYEIQFATYFGETLSEFSDSYTFTTLGCEVIPKDPAGIQAPDRLAIQSLGPTEAQLSWGMLPGASSYKLQYKIAGESKVYSQEYTDAQAHLEGLRPGARYLFRVRGNYGATEGPYSRVGQFKLPPDASMASARIAIPATSPVISSAVDPEAQLVRLYFPYDTDTQVMIEVKDGFGSIVQPKRTYTVSPRSALILSTSSWDKGAFLIRVSDHDGFADDIWVDL